MVALIFGRCSNTIEIVTLKSLAHMSSLLMIFPVLVIEYFPLYFDHFKGIEMTEQILRMSNEIVILE